MVAGEGFEPPTQVSKKERIDVAKKVWKDAMLDLDFDREDLSKICKILNVTSLEILADEVETELKIEETKSGLQQLFFVV